MDMISWDGNNDGLIRIMTHQYCDYLANMLIRSYTMYNINLTAVKAYNSGGSDHMAFWNNGIGAISSIEPGSDFHPYYHTTGDVFSLFNMNYFRNNARANLATVLSIADKLFYMINHQQIASSSDTGARVVEAAMIFGAPLGTGLKAPRLYYKIGSGSFNYVNAFEIADEIYRFRIPGQPAGTQISYYIAAQDTSGLYSTSFPEGASGVNPPGSTPPPQLLRYYVYTNSSYSSSNQKPILDLQYTRDSIYVPITGSVADITVNLSLNHANDGDLLITLLKDNYSYHLSQFNGNNGQNYTNTTFTDTAALSITQGTPPFTGVYRPQQPFSGFTNAQAQGYWVLRIYDKNAGNTGTLLNWSLKIKYSSPVSVNQIESSVADKYELMHNYPNPFNPVTTIKYSIPERSFVNIKVYDMLGKEIAKLVNEEKTQGVYSVNFDASALPTGIYFYRIQTEKFSSTKKMILIK